jgi:hypothetical protein
LVLATTEGVRDALVRTAAVVALCAAGCASPQRTIQQQQQKLESLAASAALLADDFLAGQVSPTYTRTAFDAFVRQVEQQRAVLATPALLADARAAALAQQADALSRLLARMQDDVRRGDAPAVAARRDAIAPLPRRP